MTPRDKSEMQELNQPAADKMSESERYAYWVKTIGDLVMDGEYANAAIFLKSIVLASTPPAHVFSYAAELLRAECSCGWTWQDCSKEFGRAVWVEHSHKATQDLAAQPAVVATRPKSVLVMHDGLELFANPDCPTCGGTGMEAEPCACLSPLPIAEVGAAEAVAPDKCPNCLGEKGEWIDRKDPRNPTYLQDQDEDFFEECSECKGTGLKNSAPPEGRQDGSMQIRILVTCEEGRWVAHCLELDLVAVDDTKWKSVEKLSFLIQHQIEFAIRNANESAILFPAPKEFFEKWAAHGDAK